MQLYLFSFLELTFSRPYKEIKRAKMANKETLESVSSNSSLVSSKKPK